MIKENVRLIEEINKSKLDNELYNLLIQFTRDNLGSEILLSGITDGGFPYSIKQAGINEHDLIELNKLYESCYSKYDAYDIGDANGDFAFTIRDYKNRFRLFGDDILFIDGKAYNVGVA